MLSAEPGDSKARDNALDASNALHHEVFAGDRSGLVEAADVNSSSVRDAERLGAEDGWQARVQLAARTEAEARLTVLAERDETRVDGHRELHRQLGRDDRGDDDDAVEEELGTLAILLKTWSTRTVSLTLLLDRQGPDLPLIQT